MRDARGGPASETFLEVSEIGDDVKSPVENAPPDQKITYHGLHSVEFNEVPSPGGFLHFIVAIGGKSRTAFLPARPFQTSYWLQLPYTHSTITPRLGRRSTI